MFSTLLSFFFWCLAAVFNAVMDITENENFFTSIFKNLNQKFWYKRESWKYAKKYFGWKFDAWHVAKSSMIVSISIALVFAMISAFTCSFFVTLTWYSILAVPVIFGILWNLTFNLFYHKILK